VSKAAFKDFIHRFAVLVVYFRTYRFFSAISINSERVKCDLEQPESRVHYGKLVRA